MNVKNVRFTVIPEKGIVRATIDDCALDMFDALDRYAIRPTTSNFYVQHSGKFTHIFGEPIHPNELNYMMPNSFSSIARCAPGDEFDEEIGKKIALSKLKEKYNQALTKRLTRVYNDLQKSSDLLKTYIDRQNVDGPSTLHNR